MSISLSLAIKRVVAGPGPIKRQEGDVGSGPQQTAGFVGVLPSSRVL